MASDIRSRVAAGVVGVVWAMALASPASADDDPIVLDLASADANTGAADHPQRCGDGTAQTDRHMADRAHGDAGWRFKVPDGEIRSLTAVFAPADPTGEDKEITGARGEVEPGGPVRFHDTGAYVFVERHRRLVSAVAVTTGGDTLVVAYACAGAAPDDSDEETVDGSVDGSVDGDDPTTPTGAENGRRGLPVTGAQVGGMLVLGFGLLSAGFAMTAVRRRRDVPYVFRP
jgi:LPXTG-motif cell wall-anchored protein